MNGVSHALRAAGIRQGDRIAALLANTSRYKLPRRVEFWDSLPYTPSGKLLRRRVREGLESADR